LLTDVRQLQGASVGFGVTLEKIIIDGAWRNPGGVLADDVYQLSFGYQFIR